MEVIEIPPDSQKKLLELARQTLESFVRREARESFNVEDPFFLDTRYGVFVSLHRGPELRGCIGTCSPLAPLYQEVIDMTEAAASRDYRVDPVQICELSEVAIEVSILSALQVLADPMALEVGKQGLHIANGENRGVLLPQVAIEYGWNQETFLRQICLKAGLSKHAWKWPETQLSAFTALILKEER